MCPVVLMFFYICCVICIDMLCPCICWICMNMSSPRILPLQSPNNSSVVSHIHTMPRWLKRSRRGTSAKRSWAVPDWKVKARVSTMTSAHLDMSSLKPSDISCCRFALPATLLNCQMSRKKVAILQQSGIPSPPWRVPFHQAPSIHLQSVDLPQRPFHARCRPAAAGQKCHGATSAGDSWEAPWVAHLGRDQVTLALCADWLVLVWGDKSTGNHGVLTNKCKTWKICPFIRFRDGTYVVDAFCHKHADFLQRMAGNTRNDWLYPVPHKIPRVHSYIKLYPVEDHIASPWLAS